MRLPLMPPPDNGYGQAMLRLVDSWVWDSWYVADGPLTHAFYLRASRALGDPERRHHHPLVGHSVSDDLAEWRELPDALCQAEPGAFDDQGIWTGSAVRGDDGRWHLFYTGISHAHLARIQRIGHAVSDDLVTWTRVSDEPCVSADPRWYRTFAAFGDEPWRDPWVFRHEGRWRMLITAKSAHASATGPGAEGGAGCIATAVSDDLFSWTVEEPLARDLGLEQLEVLQTLEVDGQWVCVFCMCDRDVRRPGLPKVTGTWSMPCDGPAGPFHPERAEPIDVRGNYAGRIVQLPQGGQALMAFVDVDAQGGFGGMLGNPVPVMLTDRGTLSPVAADGRAEFLGT